MAANNPTTITEVAPIVNTYYDRKLLVRARPLLVAMDFGQKRPLPAKTSKVITFRRYSNLAVATTGLTEATTPNAVQLSTTEVTATVVQYGSYVEISDVVELVVEDNVLNEAIDLLAEQMADTIETLTFTALKAGTNVFYTNGDARNTLASIISEATLDKVIRFMRRNNARVFTEIIKSATGVGSLPIRPAYWAFTHPDVVHDLEALTGFISVEKYASQGPVHQAEIGAYKNIRFLMTTMCSATLAGGANYDGTYVSTAEVKNDVYYIIVVAKEAYGLVNLEKGTAKSIIHIAGKSEAGGALEQWSSVGWKTWFVAKILNDAFITRIETCASV